MSALCILQISGKNYVSFQNICLISAQHYSKSVLDIHEESQATQNLYCCTKLSLLLSLFMTACSSFVHYVTLISSQRNTFSFIIKEFKNKRYWNYKYNCFEENEKCRPNLVFQWPYKSYIIAHNALQSDNNSQYQPHPYGWPEIKVQALARTRPASYAMFIGWSLLWMFIRLLTQTPT